MAAEIDDADHPAPECRELDDQRAELYYADGDEITEQFADYVPAEVTVTAK